MDNITKLSDANRKLKEVSKLPFVVKVRGDNFAIKLDDNPASTARVVSAWQQFSRLLVEEGIYTVQEMDRYLDRNLSKLGGAA